MRACPSVVPPDSAVTKTSSGIIDGISAPSGSRPSPVDPELCTADATPITLPEAVRMSYSVTSSGWATGLRRALAGVVMVKVTDPRSPQPTMQ